MVTTARSGARWIDHDRRWAGKGPTDPTSADGGVASEDYQIDRFHNRESMSPEAMENALAQLQATVSALDERVAALEAGEGNIRSTTRQLGMDVVELGSALARRVRALEQENAAAPLVAEALPPPAVAPPSRPDPEPAPATVAASEAQSAMLFAPSPPVARRQGPAPIAVAAGFLAALVVAAALTGGGLMYLRSHGLATRGAEPLAVTGKKTVLSGVAQPAQPIVATAGVQPKGVVARTSGSAARHGERTAAASTTSDAPTGHMLYGVGGTQTPTNPAKP